MFKILTLLTSIFGINSVSSSVTSFTWGSCGTSTDLAQNLVLSVDPVLPQTTYILYLNADFSEEIIKGTSKYSVTYNFIPLSPTTNDLCTEVSSSNITCPLSNHISMQSNGNMPTGVSGTTIITNEWFNDDGSRILCMKFNVKTT